MRSVWQQETIARIRAEMSFGDVNFSDILGVRDSWASGFWAAWGVWGLWG